MMSTKVLKSTIQDRKVVECIVVDNMIADMISNNKVNPVFFELFTKGKA